MKKIRMILPVILVSFLLTACSGGEILEAIIEELDEIQSDQEETKDYVEVDEGRFTFSVSSDYVAMESGVTFASPDKKKALGINGVALMGSYDPQGAFDAIVGYYGETNEVLECSDTVTEFTSVDGGECFVGDLTLVMEGDTLNYTEFVVVPSKNLTISLTLQVADEKELDKQVLTNLRESMDFTVASTDEISGNSFIVQEYQAMFAFASDGTVRYYKTELEQDDNYIDGTYEVIRGKDAVEEVVAMTEYGITLEELDNVMSVSREGHVLMSGDNNIIIDENGEYAVSDEETYFVCEDSFYLVKITWINSRIDGVEEEMDSVLVPFFGYYIPELHGFDCLNMNLTEPQFWERK